MAEFTQQVMNSLEIGAIYALIALGYSLVLGVLQLLNLAHGEVFMFSGFIALFAVEKLRLPFGVAALAAILGAAVLGMIVWATCFRHIKEELDWWHKKAAVVATLGFAMVLTGLATNLAGSQAQTFDVIKDVTWFVGPVAISATQVGVLAIALLLVLVLTYWVNRTGFGRAMRAVAEKPETSQLFGVNVQKLVAITFCISGALAGVASLLISVRMGVIDPFIGSRLALKALVVVVLGGLGNLKGAAIAGILMGMFEGLGRAYLFGAYTDAVVWLALLVVFLVKPSGLFGSRIAVGDR